MHGNEGDVVQGTEGASGMGTDGHGDESADEYDEWVLIEYGGGYDVQVDYAEGEEE